MQTKEKFKTVVVARINGVDILASRKDDDLVPIRPICELFGIASNVQIEKLNSNDLFCTVGMLSISTGADGKQYEMYCLPFEYCLAWMLGINAANVKPEVRERLIEYQKECVAALKEHFFGKYRMREKSFEKSAMLEAEKKSLVEKANMSDDLKRYLEITKAQKEAKIDRAKNSREVFAGMMSIFSTKEMAGK